MSARLLRVYVAFVVVFLLSVFICGAIAVTLQRVGARQCDLS